VSDTAALTVPGWARVGPRPTAAFDEFYADRFADAARLALLLTGDESVAEDLAQDAFTRLRPRFDALDAPWPYLRASVVNACRSHHRRRIRERARLLRVGTAGHLGTSAARRASAREARDFTVPGRTPSASAISRSDRSA
jgi:DNA-directed RNA polymerase specialized sigma24 family protein